KCRLYYLDESGFCATASVQYGWSPIGSPHHAFPQTHTRRSVIGALNYADNTLAYREVTGSINRQVTINFLDSLAKKLDGQTPTFVVLDNASIHHHIDHEHLNRWFLQHYMLLVFLPAYSPELNLIEMVWREAKHRWQRFIAWGKETFDEKLTCMLNGYGTEFTVNFS
ncbi:MAG: IS630 family transposase, partial [Aeromonas sp.]